MSGYELDVADLDAEQTGHLELAAWVEAVVDQCDKAGQALRDGALALAATLERTARDFEQTDQGVGDHFTPTSTGTPAPFTPWQPFPGLGPSAPATPPVYGPPAPPVYGPPAPPTTTGTGGTP
ncbi:MAG: hypothetical protein R2731_10020 [Nocardioides sp.]